MGKSVITTSLLVFVFILLDARWCSSNKASSTNTSALRCKPYERAALLNFKRSLKHFDKDVSSSWEAEDCCKWGRVACDNATGHVIKLHLHGDEINNNNLLEMQKLEESLEYLLELKQLESLDLSLNNLSYSSIPKFMGSMRQLRYLNLSHCSLGGTVPHELGNLTNLQVLDLRGDYEIVIDSLGWVTGLRELRYLNLYGADMSYAHDWLESLIGPLPYIRELHLSFCELLIHEAAHQNSSFAARLPIQYLDLSRNNFRGEIPRILQNLTSLQHLDLSNSISFAQFNLHDNHVINTDSMNLWGLVHNLCSLRSLDMSENDLQGNFLQPLQNISNNCRNHYDLEDLFLLGSSLTGEIPAWLGQEFRSLRSITLTENMLSGEIPASLSELSTLRVLDLSENMLSGEIPASLSQLSTLRVLDLSDNMLSGEIPASLSQLSTLRVLDVSQNNFSSIASSLRFPSNLETIVLSGNQLSGKIPTSIGQLSKLQQLDINSNPLEGTVLSEPHFANLSSLTNIYLGNTFLTLSLPSGWVPPFQLISFQAQTCQINGQLPPWLQTQKHLFQLDLSNANITGIIPRWFHSMQRLAIIALSNNKLSGSPIFPINFAFIDLSNNSLSENFLSNDSQKEVHYRNAATIDLSDNLISGLLPEDLAHKMPNLETLVLSSNNINGPIPKSFCQLTLLSTLDIQKNRLSGTIPKCWANISSLSLVNLSYNKLKGHIPCFYSRGPFKLEWRDQFYLLLNDNFLSGELPSCLGELTDMQILDLGGNQLSGKLPPWVKAEKLRALKILSLRGNKLSGTIPWQICSLSKLQILDIGHNNLRGSIPQCLSNLTAMSSPDTNSWDYDTDDGVSLVIQGIERAYTSTLPFLVDIDLSCNSLVGSIPNGITNLSSLLSLNLSYNQLSESIPQNIGGLKSLISLDLSSNKLRGVIPRSLGELYSLSHLNLSYNNFSGQIPTGNQLQTLSDATSIYAGNPHLCGDPLLKKCISEKDASSTGDEDNQDEDKEERLEQMWFDLVVMSGFGTGFWCVVGTLLLKRKWRVSFFGRVEDCYNWVYMAVVVRMAKPKKKQTR